MLSIWEKESFIQYDYIIAGSGIVGLSTALSIKELDPNASVLILERGLLPSGASTRNAGFACIGTVGEKLHDIKLMGEENVVQLMLKRWEGLQLLRKRVGDKNMDFENLGGYELVLQHETFDYDAMYRMNVLLSDTFKEPVYAEDYGGINRFGFNSSAVKTLIKNRLDGQLHSGKMLNRLIDLCQQKHIRIITGANITRFEETNNLLHVQVTSSFTSELTFTCKQLAICTNAFTKDLLPEVDVTPGRGQVLITSPIEGLSLQGTFNFDEGYYYFRNFGNRILFGGGRNLDFEKEKTTTFELNPQIQEKLEYYLKEIIAPGKKFHITDRWTGIMGFGKEKLPEVKRITPHISIGIKLNGMGVALGSKIGHELAGVVTIN
jgi:gamma-glutamylputrescine oxidase